LVLYHKFSPLDWWNYVSSVDKDCLMNENMTICSQEAIEGLGIDYSKFTNQLQATYTKNMETNKSNNTLLHAEKVAFASRGYINFPGVIINNMTYRGNIFPASQVVEAVCEGFIDMPPPCVELMATTVVYQKSSVKWVIAVCAVCLITLAFFLFFCYKRFLKQQISKELSFKANAAVSEYFAMQESGEKDTKGLIEMRSQV